MKVPQPAFSDWFRKRIDESIVSHTGFAERAGLSLSTVNNLKAGHPGYSKDTLSRALRAFGIRMNLQDFLSELAAGRAPDIVVPHRVHRPNETNFGRSPHRVLAIGLILIIVLSVAVFAWRPNRMPVIHSVGKSRDGQNIVLFTEKEEAGRIHVGAKIKEPFRVRVGDERLIVTSNYESKTKAYERSTVLVFDSTGTERLTYALYDTAFLTFSPPYNTASLSGIFETRMMGSGNFFPNLKDQQVWAFATEISYAVSRLTVLDLASQKPVYSLWSWGRYYSMIAEDFDGDGLDEVVATTVNNNFGKMVSKILGKPNDFYFSTVVYLEPNIEKTDCIPGFYYQPDCGCESVRWMAIIPPYNELAGNIGIEPRGSDNVIRITSQLPLLYYVLPSGQFYDVFATNAWFEKYKTSHTPALIMMRVTESEITKEIIPTCEDGETHFDLVYTAEEIEALMTLLQISMPLQNYVPSYEFNGRPIRDIDG